jgi:hypothetical protein
MLAALALPMAARAATLSIIPDKIMYAMGETVTLTVVGDGHGAVAYSRFGRLLYDKNLLDPISTSQNSAGPG